MQWQEQQQLLPQNTRAASTALAATASGAPQQQWLAHHRCTRCIACVDLRRYRHSAQSASRSGPVTASTAETWWPGVSTPTLYFLLRRKQLHLQYQQAATTEGAAKTWRPVTETRNGASALLAARRCCPLGLLIPAQYTNVSQVEDAVQLVGVKTVQLSAAHAPQPFVAVQQQQAVQQQEVQAAASVLAACADVLPRLQSQPAATAAATAKRSVPDLPAALLSPAKRQKGGAALQPALWWQQQAAVQPPPTSTPPCPALLPCLPAGSGECLPLSGSSGAASTLGVPTPGEATDGLLPLVLQRERVLEMKAERAFPVEVVVELGGVDGEQQPPSLLSSLVRLLTGN